MQVLTSRHAKTFYVLLKDGTTQEIKAGSYALTADGMWTFYKEHKIDKIRNTVVASIYCNSVKLIADAAHINMETVIGLAKNDKVNTVIRQKKSKKSDINEGTNG